MCLFVRLTRQCLISLLPLNSIHSHTFLLYVYACKKYSSAGSSRILTAVFSLRCPSQTRVVCCAISDTSSGFDSKASSHVTRFSSTSPRLKLETDLREILASACSQSLVPSLATALRFRRDRRRQLQRKPQARSNTLFKSSFLFLLDFPRRRAWYRKGRNCRFRGRNPRERVLFLSAILTCGRCMLLRGLSTGCW